MDRIRDIVRSFIESSFLPGSPTRRLDDNTSFLEIGLLDSTGVLELVDFLEEDFGVSVEDSELVPENLDSITLICRYLEKKGVSAAQLRMN